MKDSAAADCDHDFELITLAQLHLRIRAARHDFAVTFQRDALAGVAQLFEQGGKVQRCVELLGHAIEAEVNHVVALSLDSSLPGWQGGGFYVGYRQYSTCVAAVLRLSVESGIRYFRADKSRLT